MKQLFDSELKVMEPLWDDAPQPASELVRRLADTCGWNKNTTYTMIKKLVDKGVIAPFLVALGEFPLAALRNVVTMPKSVMKSTHFWCPSACSGLENNSLTPGKTLSVRDIRLLCSAMLDFM